MTVVCTKCGALSIAQCTCSVITHNQYVYGGAIQMTVICTKCGALSVHQCQCLNPVTLTGRQTPLPPTAPSKPSPGEGYRWLVPKVDTIAIDDELDIGDGCWLVVRSSIGKACNQAYLFRRRIEPQVEPAKPERQAIEIEKRAALTALGPLFEDCHDAMRDAMDERDYDYLYDCWTNVEGVFRRYREMYDYAKSIGAIE